VGAIHRTARSLTAWCCVALLVQPSAAWTQTQQAQQTPQKPATTTAPQQAAKIPNDQLDSLVAPIALYPDPLLAQVLAASTYPLEIVQLQQWLAQHTDLKGDALATAVEKQGWDPSVQGLAALPDVVKRLADDIKWTADLGNAFLAQEKDVMDAVQRMRKKASDTGNLKTTEQQKVTTQTVESKQVIVIEQASPQVVYVPSYNPTVVYGPPVYPYPPIYYPPPGYYAAGMAIGFGMGVAMGAFWGGGGWGYHPGWGYGNVNVNVNNRYVNNYNRVNANNRINTGNWNHNAAHRGGAPYGDRNTANRYGGSARGDSLSQRQNTARQNVGTNTRQGTGAGATNRTGSAGANRTGSAAGAGAGNAGANRSSAGSTGGGDRVGNRSVSNSSAGSRNSNAFSGASSGRSSAGAARSSSQRGSSSVGASRSRGGGGRR
jgi:hypothetical protein